jgi:hypothetical protein
MRPVEFFSRQPDPLKRYSGAGGTALLIHIRQLICTTGQVRCRWLQTRGEVELRPRSDPLHHFGGASSALSRAQQDRLDQVSRFVDTALMCSKLGIKVDPALPDKAEAAFATETSDWSIAPVVIKRLKAASIRRQSSILKVISRRRRRTRGRCPASSGQQDPSRLARSSRSRLDPQVDVQAALPASRLRSFIHVD